MATTEHRHQEELTSVTSFDGTRLALRTSGPAQAPLVVLVHGLGLSTDTWDPVVERLREGHRVVAYDLRGHAQSGDAPGRDYSLRAHTADLDAVLDAVTGPGRRAVVVGNSLGGGVVVAHAHHHGTAGVAGVVFAGSGGSGVTFPGLPARGLPVPARRALRSAWWQALRTAAFLGRGLRGFDDLSAWMVRRSAFAPDEPHELVVRVRDSFLGSRPAALSGTTLASVSHDGTRLAPDLDVPTLVVHGSRDPEVPGSEVEQLMSELPDGELVTIPEAGHMLPLTHPAVVAEQVARWVGHVDAAGRDGEA